VAKPFALLPAIASALLLVAAGGNVAVSHAADVAVTNQNDSGPGSLRQAIANADPGQIVIVPAGTYMLTTGELTVAKSLSILGAEASSTIIDAQTASRVFHTEGAGNDITISGVTIRNGKAVPTPGGTLVEGGGVLNDNATLTLSHDVISGNQAFADTFGRDGNGGAAEGGGVFSSGTLNVSDTDIHGNSATAVGAFGHNGGLAAGGGIEALGGATVRGSTFADNLADARGGQGPVNPNQSGGNAQGGGLLLSPIGTGLPSTTVSSTTVKRNVADGSAGPGASGGFAKGGGALMEDGIAPILETNVTFTGNVAQSLAGQTTGGGIFFTGDGVGQSLTNVTIAGNSATAGISNLGGNIFVSLDDTVSSENTLITGGAADPGSENCAANGILASRGHNIDSRDQCGFNATGDLVNTSPLLAPLADNGGSVQTIALQPASPGIDAGAAAECPSTDARGVLRPAGGGCDIGAFEIAAPGAMTAEATAVTSSSAVLDGAASNPGLTDGSTFFEYGPTPAYGSTTPLFPVGATTADAHLGVPLAGLKPGSTYHFRIVVSNAAGSARGADRTFTTPPDPPTSTTTADPTSTTSPDPTPTTPPPTAPRIAGLKITPAVVSRKRGATVTYTDTGAATTTFSVQGQRPGRVRGHSCVAQTMRNRSHRRCTRWVRIGRAFTHADTPGREQWPLPGQTIAKLRPGKYRLAATPSASGLSGQTVTAGFRVSPR
jgi:hypothetical protein